MLVLVQLPIVCATRYAEHRGMDVPGGTWGKAGTVSSKFLG